ncbi:MAG: hypothetical protein ABIF71_10565 [Planctomycetota bacterium]
MVRRLSLLFLLLGLGTLGLAQDANSFYPMTATTPAETCESHTGLWACTSLGKAETALPLLVPVNE